MLKSLDLQKLEEIERMRRQAGGGAASVELRSHVDGMVTNNVQMGDVHRTYKFTGMCANKTLNKNISLQTGTCSEQRPGISSKFSV